MSLLFNDRQVRDTYLKVAPAMAETPGRSPVGLVEGFQQGFGFGVDVDWMGAEAWIKKDFVGDAVRKYEEITGGPFPFAELPKVDFKNDDLDSMNTTRRIQNYLGEWLKKNPEHADKFNLNIQELVDQEFARIGAEHEFMAQHASTAGSIGLGIGQFSANMVDPTLLGISALGGLALGAGTKGISLLRGITTEAVLGTGTELIATPGLVSRYEKAGQPLDSFDIMLNLAGAGVGSGALYAGMRGVSRASRMARDKYAGLDQNSRHFIDWLERSELEMFDSPFRIGDDLNELRRHFDLIDDTTLALIRGFALPRAEVRVDKINYDIQVPEFYLREAMVDLDDPEFKKNLLLNSKQFLSDLADEMKMVQTRAKMESLSRLDVDLSANERLKLVKTGMKQGTTSYEYGPYRVNKLKDGQWRLEYPDGRPGETFKTQNEATKAADTDRVLKQDRDVDAALEQIPEWRQRMNEGVDNLHNRLNQKRNAVEAGDNVTAETAPRSAPSAEDIYPITAVRQEKLTMAKRAFDMTATLNQNLKEIELGREYQASQAAPDETIMVREGDSVVKKTMAQVMKENEEEQRFLSELAQCMTGAINAG